MEKENKIDKAIDEIRECLSERFGKEYISDSKRVYKNKNKNQVSNKNKEIICNDMNKLIK